MSFNTDWDVEQYKTEHESDEHWELRRNFMLTHKNDFPEERLVCLAQVFTNVEFLGCRYPQETMELIAHLSEGVADKYREKQKTKLQRTFVKASDAAGAKVKGLKRHLGEATISTTVPSKFIKISADSQLTLNDAECSEVQGINTDPPKPADNGCNLENSPIKSMLKPLFPGNIKPPEDLFSKTAEKIVNDVPRNYPSRTVEKVVNDVPTNSPCKTVEKVVNYVPNYPPHTDTIINDVQTNQPIPSFQETSIRPRFQPERKEVNFKKVPRIVPQVDEEMDAIISAGKFGRLVLIEAEGDAPFKILQRSTLACGISFENKVSRVQQNVFCRICVNDQVVVSATDSNWVIAREVAETVAVERLRDMCYTLRIKKFKEIDVDMTNIDSIEISDGKESCAPGLKGFSLTTPLPEDNVGSKLLRSMGWTGGGLGKTEQGIQEPISVSMRVNRAGLGTRKQEKKDVDETFKVKVRIYLLEYLKLDDPPNLILQSVKFSKMERDTTSLIAKSLGLQSKNEGKRTDARLVIFRRDTLALAALKMIRDGISGDDYHEIIKPKGPSDCNHELEVEASAFPYIYNKAIDTSSKTSKSIYRRWMELANRKESARSKTLKKANIKPKSSASLRKFSKVRWKINSNCKRDYEEHEELTKNGELDKIVVGPYGSFYLIEEESNQSSPAYILNRSSKYHNSAIVYQCGCSVTGPYCEVSVNGHLLTSACGETAIIARQNATQDAYEKLKQICYTLKIKGKLFAHGITVSKDLTMEGTSMSDSAKPESQCNSLDKPLKDNIGSKLMRSMGWTGGGLGKEGQGIEEPVGLSQQIKRNGLGLSVNNNIRNFVEVIQKMFEEYVKKDSEENLVFSPEFSKEERACIHNAAQIYRLKSRSYGKEPFRRLVISRKKNFSRVVADMLKSGVFSTQKYELIKPSITLPPENPLSFQETDNHRNDPVSNSPILCNDKTTDPFIPSKEMTPEDNLVLCTQVVEKSEEASSGKSLEQSPDFCKIQMQWPVLDAGKLGRLILIEDENCSEPVQIIERSANGCHVSFKYFYSRVKRKMECKLYINYVLVTSKMDINKKLAREATVIDGIEKLREVCYTLRTQLKVGESELNVTKTLILPSKRGVPVGGSTSESHILCSSKQVNRATLGMLGSDAPPSMFKNSVRSFLQEYASENVPYDLVFTPDFSSPERVSIQQIASGLGLKSNVHTVTKQDFLVLSKKRSPLETAEAILCFNSNTRNRTDLE